VDGLKVGTVYSSCAPNPPPTASDLYIGSGQGAAVAGDPAAHFKGLIDEPSLYNQALTAEELLRIYLVGSVGKASALYILEQPVGQIVQAGQDATFAVQARSDSTLAYQWFHDGTTIVSGTNDTLTLIHLTYRDAGEYTVAVRDAAGRTKSGTARLAVYSTDFKLTAALHGATPLLGLTIGGMAGQYDILCSTNLTDLLEWTTLTNITLTGLPQLWLDNIPVGSQTQRLYRVAPAR